MSIDPDQDPNPDVAIGEEAYAHVSELIANPPEPSPALRALLRGERPYWKCSREKEDSDSDSDEDEDEDEDEEATPAPKKSALELAHEAMRRRREAGEVIERLSPIEKARKNPTSLRLAVNGKCWDCIGGDSEDPNPRARIRDCGVTHCPLYSVRPFQGAKGVSGFVANSEDGSEEVDGEA